MQPSYKRDCWSSEVLYEATARERAVLFNSAAPTTTPAVATGDASKAGSPREGSDKRVGMRVESPSARRRNRPRDSRIVPGSAAKASIRSPGTLTGVADAASVSIGRVALEGPRKACGPSRGRRQWPLRKQRQVRFRSTAGINLDNSDAASVASVASVAYRLLPRCCRGHHHSFMRDSDEEEDEEEDEEKVRPVTGLRSVLAVLKASCSLVFVLVGALLFYCF